MGSDLVRIELVHVIAGTGLSSILNHLSRLSWKEVVSLAEAFGSDGK